MGNEVNEKISALGVQIGVSSTGTRDDYLSLTDIARYKSDEPNDVIKNWMRTRSTIEFLGIWEELHNKDFKPVEFERFKNEAGANAFTMSPSKWVSSTGAKGIKVKRGRYGGATLHQLIVLANLESMNAQLIKEGRSRQERAEYLNAMAREQLAALADNPTIKAIEEGSAEGRG